MKKKMQKRRTLPIIGMERIIVPMRVASGSTESVRSGRKTRMTRSAETFDPMPGTSDTRLTTTTTKSITFHPSFRYASRSKNTPEAIILTSISIVKTTVKKSSLSSMAEFPGPYVDAAGVPEHPRPSILEGCI